MKNIFYYLLFSALFLVNTESSKANGIDVSVSLSDNTGGGSSSLNSTTKPKDKGEQKSGSGENIYYTIKYSYEIVKIKNSSFKLLVDLKMKQIGKKEETYNKSIVISKDGKQIINPFNGITMQVNSKGIDTK